MNEKPCAVEGLVNLLRTVKHDNVKELRMSHFKCQQCGTEVNGEIRDGKARINIFGQCPKVVKEGDENGIIQ